MIQHVRVCSVGGGLVGERAKGHVLKYCLCQISQTNEHGLQNDFRETPKKCIHTGPVIYCRLTLSRCLLWFSQGLHSYILSTSLSMYLLYHFWHFSNNFLQCVIIGHLSTVSPQSLTPHPLSTFMIPSPCRTATSRRRLTMRSGCVMEPASCWQPAPRGTRRWRQQRACRPAAHVSWPTCRSCRG